MKRLLFAVVPAVILVFSSVTCAVEPTAEEIVDSVIEELENVTAGRFDMNIWE